MEGLRITITKAAGPAIVRIAIFVAKIEILIAYKFLSRRDVENSHCDSWYDTGVIWKIYDGLLLLLLLL